MIRAEEDTLTNLVCNWSAISSSRGWSIDYLHKFQDQISTANDSPPTSNNRERSDESANGALPDELPDSDVAPSTSSLQVSLVQTDLLSRFPED